MALQYYHFFDYFCYFLLKFSKASSNLLLIMSQTVAKESIPSFKTSLEFLPIFL